MGVFDFLDEPKSRKKKSRRKSAWVEHEHRYRTYSAAQSAQGYLLRNELCKHAKIVELPNETYLIFKKG